MQQVLPVQTGLYGTNKLYRYNKLMVQDINYKNLNGS